MAVYWQLCVRTNEGISGHTYPDYEAQMDAVLEQLYARDPGVPVYLSWLMSYSFEGCAQVDWEAEERLLDYGASLGLLTGPVTGPLSSDQTKDGCHPNGAGSALVGAQLIEFFDD